MTEQEQAEETGTLATHDPDPAKEEDTHGNFRQVPNTHAYAHT